MTTKYKFIVKNLQGKTLYKSVTSFERADYALKQGDIHHKKSSYPIGAHVDVLPINISV